MEYFRVTFCFCSNSSLPGCHIPVTAPQARTSKVVCPSLMELCYTLLIEVTNFSFYLSHPGRTAVTVDTAHGEEQPKNWFVFKGISARCVFASTRASTWALKLKDSYFDHLTNITTPNRLNVANTPVSLSKLSVPSRVFSAGARGLLESLSRRGNVSSMTKTNK